MWLGHFLAGLQHRCSDPRQEPNLKVGVRAAKSAAAKLKVSNYASIVLFFPVLSVSVFGVWTAVCVFVFGSFVCVCVCFFFPGDLCIFPLRSFDMQPHPQDWMSFMYRIGARTITNLILRSTFDSEQKPGNWKIVSLWSTRSTVTR